MRGRAGIAVVVCGFVAVAALPGAGGQRGAAQAAKRVRCPHGTLKIRLNARPACLRKRELKLPATVPSLEEARRGLAARATSRGAQRLLLGRRGLRLLGRSAGAPRRLAKQVAPALAGTANARPRARVAEPRGQAEQPPAGYVGSGATVSNSFTDAKGVTTAVTMGFSGFVAECPGSGGDLPGTASASFAEEIRGPVEGPGRRRFSITVDMELRATLAGHVAADGKLRDYDLDATSTVTSRLRVLGPAGLEHTGTTKPYNVGALVVLVGLRPRAVFDQSAVRSLTISDPRPQDVQVDGRQVLDAKAFMNQLVGLVSMAKGQADSAFERAQHNFYDNAQCLSARFDPPEFSGTPGRPIPLQTTVVDRAGARVATDLTADPTGASVSPRAARTTETQPAQFTLTPDGSLNFASLRVDGSSVRGRVNGVISGPVVRDRAAAYLYSVSLSGTGTYTEDSETTGSHDLHFRDIDFSFSASWPVVVVPADGLPPSSPSTFHGAENDVTGTAQSSGSHPSDGSSFQCNAPLADSNPASNVVAVGTPAGGAVPVTINGFHGLTVSGGSCTKTGSFFSSPQPAAHGSGGNDIPDGEAASVSLTQGQIDSASFTVPLDSPPFPDRCASDGDPFYCSHTLTWHATVTFVRRFACQRVGAYYACGGAPSGLAARR